MNEFTVKINKNNLPEENEQFPSDFQSIATDCARAEASYNRARIVRKTLQAETLLTLKADGVKRTGAEMEATIESSPAIKEAREAELNAQEYYLIISSAMNAMEQKSFALKNLTALSIGGFYAGTVDKALTEVASADVRAKLNKKDK